MISEEQFKIFKHDLNQPETNINHDGNKVTVEAILGIKLNFIKGDFDKHILMTEDGQREIRSFSYLNTIDDLKARCIKVLQEFKTLDINILAATHYTEDGRFFDIFAREMYVDGKWVTYWLKDIRTDLKKFIV